MWPRRLAQVDCAWPRKRICDHDTGLFVKEAGGSNRLFCALFVLSVGVHALVFMHLAGTYRSGALSFIELTLQNVSKPVERNIPRPRPRAKERYEPVYPSRPRIETHHIPPLKPMRIEPTESLVSDGLMERIDAAPVPQVPGAAIFGSDLGKADSSSFKEYDTADAHSFKDHDTADAYLEMVRLRIDKHKQYPTEARAAHMEGRVIVRFTITTDGGLRSVEVRGSSRKKPLDEAAINAVRSAAPFPVPPRHLFEGDIPLQLTIVFELT